MPFQRHPLKPVLPQRLIKHNRHGIGEIQRPDVCLLYTSLLIFTKTVYFPLKKITYGANEYADGNLKYNIDLKTSDEMGYLAATLDYMSDELEKMEEYQRRFIANVSHDFRSPLTSIKGYVEAIIDGTVPRELEAKYLNIVISETCLLYTSRCV